MNASLSTCLEFVADVDAGRRIVAHQDDTKPRLPTSRRQSRSSQLQLCTKVRRQRYAVDNLCAHVAI